jgi:uncharacterized protein
VESAIVNAENTLGHDHIDTCLRQAVRGHSQKTQDTIREF